MSRYRGPKLRITRRLGKLPGLITKWSRKQNPPGKSGDDKSDDKKYKKNKKKPYLLRLEEKQKLKFNFGLTENQLYRYIKEARRQKGVTGLILLQLLEMRLDVICFTLGFGSTISQARQLVNHGHINVNGKLVNIPSFQCCLNDIISVKNKPNSINLIKNNLKKLESKTIKEVPTHLKFDKSKLEGVLIDYCDIKDVSIELNDLLVIEYYSRK